jgi:hypothetical protein
LNTGALPIHERCKVLVCDYDSGDASWVSRRHVAFYPFKGQASSDENFTEIFSKREAVGNTQEFQDALALAHMFYDTPNRDEALKLLQMGRLGRQKLILLHNNLVAHKKFCEDVKEEISARKGAKKRNCNHQIQKKTTKKKATIEKKTIQKKASIEKQTTKKKATIEKKTIQKKASIEKQTTKKKATIQQKTIQKKAPIQQKTIQKKASIEKKTIKNKASIFHASSCEQSKKPKNPIASKPKPVALTKAKRTACNRTNFVVVGTASSHRLESKNAPENAPKLKNGDGSTRDKKNRQALPAASGSAHKRPSSSAKNAADAGAALINSRKKHKPDVVGMEAEAVSSNVSSNALPSLESKLQIMQQAQPKRDSCGYQLCAHNRRAFNCPKCAFKNTFVNYKPQTDEDFADDIA